jgi:hypothetical protein
LKSQTIENALNWPYEYEGYVFFPKEGQTLSTSVRGLRETVARECSMSSKMNFNEETAKRSTSHLNYHLDEDKSE